MKEILSRVYFGNTVQDYLIATGLVLGIMLALRLFRNFFLGKLKTISAKTDSTYDDFFVFILEKKIIPLLNLFAIYSGVHSITLSEKADRYIMAGLKVATVYFVARLITASLQFAFEQMVNKNKTEELSSVDKRKELRGIMIIVKVIIWLLALVFLLDNLGYDVTAVITGLGIGGIAIALAAQTILGDLFSYFVIFFDRPFEIGDFITVDDKSGNIEYVGIKTTRIKSITGEQLIVSNTNLTNSRVHNFKKMERRRIVFTIGVTYQTPKDKLEKIPGIIKGIIETTENAEFDRSHFFGFGNFSLDFESVYFIKSNDYKVYMEARQQINLQIFEAFEKEGIEFAYPTQTLFVEKSVQPSS